MAPLLTKAMYAACDLFDITPSGMHIRDLIHAEEHYQHRTSDLVTGMLLLAVKERVISKVEASWFAVPFIIHAKLRSSVYKHEGAPFLGPDGGILIINGKPFTGASAGIVPTSIYTLDTVIVAPNYEAWLANVLFRGSSAQDSDFGRSNAVPPKRYANGVRVST